jgi:hypothetical protein
LPFTVSHVAAALPLHASNKGRLPLAALVIDTASRRAEPPLRRPL